MDRRPALLPLLLLLALLGERAWGDDPRVRTDPHGDPLPEGVRFRLGTMRFRHEGTVNALTWMADGKSLISSSYDDPARLWRATDGKELRRLNKSGAIGAFAVTRDGRLIAQTSGGVIISQAATGKEIRVLEIPPISGAGRLHFSPNGKMLLVCCLVGHRTQLYAVESGEKLLDFAGEHYGHSAFSPDGKSILTGTDKGVLCRAIATDMNKRTLPAEGGYIFTPVFSPDGKKLAAADSIGKGLIWVWSWPEGKLLHRLKCPDAIVRDAAFSPDGRTLATVGDRGHGLRLWDMGAGVQRHHLAAYENQINAVAFSPDGSLLATGGDNRCVSVWDMHAAREPRLLPKHNRRFTAVTLTPDGKLLATAERDGSIVLWDAFDGHEIRRLESWDHSAVQLAISPDGKWMAACAQVGPVGLWDVGTGRRRPGPDGTPATLGCVAFSPDSDLLALGDEQGSLHVCAMKTGAKVRTIHRKPPIQRLQLPQHPGVRALAWSADGSTLAIGYWDGTIAFHDPNRGRQPLGWQGPKGGGVFAFSDDGRMLAVGQGSALAVYERATGREVQRVSVPSLCILSVAFAPGGRALAFGGGTRFELRYYNHYYVDGRDPSETSHSIRLWDLDANNKLQCLTGHTLQVESLTFSPDGARLVSGSADTTSLCWDVAVFTRRQAKHGPAPSTSRLSELWNDLATSDAARGQKAVRELISWPDSALAFLAAKLRPAPPQPSLPSLLADLDSDEFARRDRATRELEQLGRIAAPALRNALEQKPSLEARKRMEMLLQMIDGQIMAPEQLRTVRALQVLESIGSPEACRILEGLSRGAAEAELTQEAKASLHRLARRSVKP